MIYRVSQKSLCLQNTHKTVTKIDILYTKIKLHNVGGLENTGTVVLLQKVKSSSVSLYAFENSF